MRPISAASAAALLLASGFAAQAAPRELDRAKSEIAFKVTQMGVPVSGRFGRFDAKVDLDAAEPEKTTAEVSVDIASLSTGDTDADEVALDKPWLDLARFPKATFKSSAVRALAEGRYEVSGELTIRGAARAVTVPLTTKDQPDGSTLATGELRIRRSDFGIGGGEWNEGDLVANEVPVTFRLHLLPPKGENP